MFDAPELTAHEDELTVIAVADEDATVAGADEDAAVLAVVDSNSCVVVQHVQIAVLRRVGNFWKSLKGAVNKLIFFT